MHFFLSDKIVVITGGSEGIGKALIENLIRANAIVATCGRDAKKLKQLKEQIVSDRLFTFTCDVTKKKDCQDFIKAVIQRFERIDILINNAGISMRSEFIDTDIEVFEKIMNTNFYGTMYCTKFALPYLINSQGTLVGISSIAGYRGTPGRSAYSASKFAMNGFLESLRVELKHHNVSVITIAPGFISSQIRYNALDGKGALVNETHLKEKKLMTPKQCAEKIVDAIKNKNTRVSFTLLGKVTVFLNKFFPRYSDLLVRNFYYHKNKLVK